MGSNPTTRLGGQGQIPPAELGGEEIVATSAACNPEKTKGIPIVIVFICS